MKTVRLGDALGGKHRGSRHGRTAVRIPPQGQRRLLPHRFRDILGHRPDPRGTVGEGGAGGGVSDHAPAVLHPEAVPVHDPLGHRVQAVRILHAEDVRPVLVIDRDHHAIPQRLLPGVGVQAIAEYVPRVAPTLAHGGSREADDRRPGQQSTQGSVQAAGLASLGLIHEDHECPRESMPAPLERLQCLRERAVVPVWKAAQQAEAVGVELVDHRQHQRRVPAEQADKVGSALRLLEGQSGSLHGAQGLPFQHQAVAHQHDAPPRLRQGPPQRCHQERLAGRHGVRHEAAPARQRRGAAGCERLELVAAQQHLPARRGDDPIPRQSQKPSRR